jgi:hypothetical protein
MLDLYDELAAIIRALNDARVDYALCGGLAMAVYGLARATEDVDLLVRPEDYDSIKSAVANAGYTFEARPMPFKTGLQIRPLTKIVAADHVILDLLLVYDDIEGVWDDRREIDWNGLPLFVVNKEGLIRLKEQRKSGQDLDDIAWLKKTNQ